MIWTDTPCLVLVTMSSTSNVVLTGRTISANRQSFSSHGCWATMHSIFGFLIASIVSLPPFQQVVRQGVSVQIICISVPPSSLGKGYLYSMNWSSTGVSIAPVPQKVMGGLGMALWMRVLGISCFPQAKTVVLTGLVKRSPNAGLKNRVVFNPSALGIPVYVICAW
ncbi:hypothetical protein ES703_123585 [subsurface metagenome]